MTNCRATIGTKRRPSGPLSVLKNPITKQPRIFTTIVPQGKVSPKRLATTTEPQKRAAPPSALPIMTQIKFCSPILVLSTLLERGHEKARSAAGLQRCPTAFCDAAGVISPGVGGFGGPHPLGDVAPAWGKVSWGVKQPPISRT